MPTRVNDILSCFSIEKDTSSDFYGFTNNIIKTYNSKYEYSMFDKSEYSMFKKYTSSNNINHNYIHSLISKLETLNVWNEIKLKEYQRSLKESKINIQNFSDK